MTLRVWSIKGCITHAKVLGPHLENAIIFIYIQEYTISPVLQREHRVAIFQQRDLLGKKKASASMSYRLQV